LALTARLDLSTCSPACYNAACHFDPGGQGSVLQLKLHCGFTRLSDTDSYKGKGARVQGAGSMVSENWSPQRCLLVRQSEKLIDSNSDSGLDGGFGTQNWSICIQNRYFAKEPYADCFPRGAACVCFMFAENTEGSNITGSAASMCRGTSRLECYVGSRDLLARERLERAVNAVTTGPFLALLSRRTAPKDPAWPAYGVVCPPLQLWPPESPESRDL